MSQAPTHNEIGADITALEGRPVALEDATIIHTFPLGRDIGIVSISSFNGKQGLDVRRFYLDGESGTWKPTAKGLRMPMDVLKPLSGALHGYAGRFA